MLQLIILVQCYRTCTLVWLLGLLVSSQALTLEQETCSVDRMVVDNNVAGADVVLGGIFDIRMGGTNGYGCGEPYLGLYLCEGHSGHT